MRTHYLIDHEYLFDPATLHASMGHLLVFNPGERDATLRVTLFFEDAEPQVFEASAPAGASTESNYKHWPVEPNSYFALRVESSEPVICQSTVGWNNSGNDYAPSARTHSPHGVRECAKSYMAITGLAQEWYLADGLVIKTPGAYVRESEWAIILNPGEAPATVVLTYFYEPRQEHAITVPAQRLRRVRMDDIARHNKHYGMRITGDQPIAAQWLRTVRWSDDSELMAYWSVPCVPGPLA